MANTLKTINYYLHNNYEMSEIRELLKNGGLSSEVLENLAEQIYSRFYEVKFEITYDAKGDILGVAGISTKNS